ENVKKVIETIRNVAKTDPGGDGRIYVTPLDESVHIHSGDKHLGDSSEKELEGDELH
ncbi:MAG: P-II family nitrogen regulator, partial [Planctomycetes bacterium]|nr:P-II family nitrogen regulator [Planctomycetota bacterium]